MTEQKQKRKPLVLSNDPKQALQTIAEKLHKMPRGDENRYPLGSDKRAFTGYIVPIDFALDLLELACEAERVVAADTDQSSS